MASNQEKDMHDIYVSNDFNDVDIYEDDNASVYMTCDEYDGDNDDNNERDIITNGCLYNDDNGHLIRGTGGDIEDGALTKVNAAIANASAPRGQALRRR